MTLLDTDVLIYAFDRQSVHRDWAQEVISDAVSGDGAAISAVSLAELCVGDADPATVADRVRSWGVSVADVPAAAAEPCARAYVEYRAKRDPGNDPRAPVMPLPDFFVGAHAEVMGWTLATADRGRFKTYFPSVVLEMPS